MSLELGSIGHIAAVCVSEKKGMRKKDVGRGQLIENHGLEGDAHAGPWHRQVSLLAMESIEKMRAAGLNVGPGAFAENLTTVGLDLVVLPIGTRVEVRDPRTGGDAGGPLLEVTQIGKECHSHCAIYEQAGDCVMPREGIFVRVIRGGSIKVGDALIVAGAAEVEADPGDPSHAEVLPPFTAGILTASDKGSRGEREDKSGRVIAEIVEAAGGKVAAYEVIPDDEGLIKEKLIVMADQMGVDLILTTGGTGLAPRDHTPEATLAACDRPVPGIPEAIRQESLKKTSRAMLSRAVAGTRGRSLIINLPGSPRAVRECLEVVMPVLGHALELLRGEGGECARPDKP
ncbi:MAG TPA: molybdenum cofactor synthesis domain-containing protein [Bacillota bacterium]|jgi:molybdenum cofactor synthesis domain-containing protein